VTGRADLFPTTMEEGRGGGEVEDRIPAPGVVWYEAPESATQSETEVGGASVIVEKELVRDYASHPLVQGPHTGWAGGPGRGRSPC
jgi:hypothetical protein